MYLNSQHSPIATFLNYDNDDSIAICLSPAQPTVEAVNSVVNGFKGQTSIELQCQVISGNPPPQVQWFYHGEQLSDSVFYRLPDNGSLVIVVMVPHLAGDYSCFAQNLMGNDTAQVTLEYAGKVSYCLSYIATQSIKNL